MGFLGINSSKSESQFFKIQTILKLNKVAELKLKPLRIIEFDSNFNELNNLVKNKNDRYDKYLFITNNGRWEGYIDEKILKSVSIKKWDRTFVGDFRKPINTFTSIKINTELWKTVEKIEKTKEGILLVLNPADIPLGIVDRTKVGSFVFNKLGLDLPTDILRKFNEKNQYPLGIELPRIIKLMKKNGDL